MIGPLAYIGGKRRLAATITDLLPAHTTYVEPFCGGAQVFFHKRPSRVEILNDLDGDVYRFLQVCQQHPAELARWLRWATASRRLFDVFQKQPPELLTDIQRAARFLYLQKNCFGGRRIKRSFHYAVVKPANYSPLRLPKLLEATANRLASVQIESLPYEQVLARYDRSSTVFYCDPPYVGLRLYQHNFQDVDFVRLAERLASIRGRFLLSINDTPLSRKVFAQFFCKEISLVYSSSKVSPRVTELLFSNFELPAIQNAANVA